MAAQYVRVGIQSEQGRERDICVCSSFHGRVDNCSASRREGTLTDAVPFRRERDSGNGRGTDLHLLAVLHQSTRDLLNERRSRGPKSEKILDF